MQDRNRRQLVCKQLPPDLRDNIAHYDENLLDVLSIVCECANHWNGLAALIDVVEFFERNSHPFVEVRKEWQFIQSASGLSDTRLVELMEIVRRAQINEPVFKGIFSGLRSEFPGIQGMTLDPLWRVAQTLWDVHSELGEIHPVQVFVEYLAYHVETFSHEADLADELRVWNDHHADGFGATSDDLHCRRKSIQDGLDFVAPGDFLSLMVALEPDPKNTAQTRHFRIQVFLWNTSYRSASACISLYTGEHFESWDEIGQQLITLVEDLPGAIDTTHLCFEFFLPVQYISEAVDQLQYKDDFRPVRLGATYQVVVRSLDRARSKKPYPYWSIRWNNYRSCAKSGMTPNISRVFDALPDDPEQLLIELQADGDGTAACVGLGCVVPDINHIMTLLSAGVPIALWARPYENAGCPSEDVAQKVRALTDSENIPDLPRLVHQERRRANSPSHPGNHLTLLWDDPTRIPEGLKPLRRNRLQAP